MIATNTLIDTSTLIEKNQHPFNELMSQRYDWHSIKNEYVEGRINENDEQSWPTMKELALKHGIPPAYLRRVASAQKWTLEKNNYITNYEHAKQAERIRYLSKKSSKFDSKCIKIAEEGVRKIEQLICSPVINENGVQEVLNLMEIELASKTLERLQKIGRLALGNSTDNVTKSIKAATDAVSFPDGMDIIMQQIESNPELMKKIELEFID